MVCVKVSRHPPLVQALPQDGTDPHPQSGPQAKPKAARCAPWTPLRCPTDRIISWGGEQQAALGKATVRILFSAALVICGMVAPKAMASETHAVLSQTVGLEDGLCVPVFGVRSLSGRYGAPPWSGWFVVCREIEPNTSAGAPHRFHPQRQLGGGDLPGYSGGDGFFARVGCRISSMSA